jgi:transcription-repair coupling factor (superfamily II helicase)
MDVYKKIACVTGQAEALDVRDELIDRFGDIPQPVLNLINIALLRNRASRGHIQEITQKGDAVTFNPETMEREAVMALTRAFKGRLSFSPGPRVSFAVERKNGEDALLLIHKVLGHIDLQKESMMI